MTEPTAETNPQAGAEDANKSQALNSNPQAGAEPNPNLISKEEYEKLDGKHKKLLEEVKGLRDRANRFDSEQEEKLKAQGEYKTIAEKHEARVKELEPAHVALQERYATLAAIAKKRIASEAEAWPDEIKALLPQGDEVDTLELIAAIEKYTPLVAKFTAAASPGARPNQPKPTGQGAALTPLVSAVKRL